MERVCRETVNHQNQSGPLSPLLEAFNPKKTTSY